MKIALDYDETITADRILWSLFINLAKNLNHEVVIVTYRSVNDQNYELEDFASNNNVEIIYTAGKQKSQFFDADIWIDDRPELIPAPSILRGIFNDCKRY